MQFSEHEVIEVGEFEIELCKTLDHAVDAVSALTVGNGGKKASLDDLEQLLRSFGTWEKVVNGLRGISRTSTSE
jgi:hypothetical protein